MTRTLVAYYSMSGNTRALANEISTKLGADLEEITEPTPRHGAIGMARAMFDALLHRSPPIAPTTHDPARYDVLLIGGPVWAGHIASPMRSFAARYGPSAAHVAFFCTESGHGAEGAFAELEQVVPEHARRHARGRRQAPATRSASGRRAQLRLDPAHAALTAAVS